MKADRLVFDDFADDDGVADVIHTVHRCPHLEGFLVNVPARRSSGIFVRPTRTLSALAQLAPAHPIVSDIHVGGVRKQRRPHNSYGANKHATEHVQDTQAEERYQYV